MDNAARGHWLHEAFEASLILKAVFAAAEALAGLALFVPMRGALIRAAHWLTVHEVAEDPADPLAQWLLAQAQAFSIEVQHFWAWYLLGHGALKLAVVYGLFRGWRAAYPAGMAVLGGFVVWQVHHWLIAGSPVLLAISGFDLLVIWLIRQEWRAHR